MREGSAGLPADTPRVLAAQPTRIGLIVPGSNVTMEHERPELMRRREAIAPERACVQMPSLASFEIGEQRLGQEAA